MSNLLNCFKHANKYICYSLRQPCIDFKMPFYAVACGRTLGIFQTWAQCESQVKGFKGAKFKKFNSQDEAARFVAGGAQYLQSSRDNTSLRTRPTVKSIPRKCNQSISSNSTVSSSVNFENVGDINSEIMRKMDNITKDIKHISSRFLTKPEINKKTILIDAVPAATVRAVKRPAEPTQIVDTKRKKTGISRSGKSYDFDTDESGFVEVYTDGACSGNGTSSARAGLGVYFGEEHPLNVSEPVSGRATNNCGEIQATTRAINIAHSMGISKLSIKTDSQFVIKSATQWMSGWKRKGWKLASGGPVKNQEDFVELDKALKLLEVKWEYVNAHSGIHGNERADQLAKAGAERYRK